MRQRLAETDKQFVFLDRRITPQQEIEINNLGIPGIDFLPTEERHYPMGHVASHVLGGVDVDEHGVAGVEKWFDKRLMTDNSAAAPVPRCARAGRGARRTAGSDR